MVSGSFKKVLCGVLLWTAISFSAVLVDRVVASVNSEPILESDVKMGMLFYEGLTKRQVIDKLVEHMLLYQFLIGKGLQVPQELIDGTIQNIARANKTDLEGLARELAKENLTLQDLRRFLERELLATQGLMAFLGREIKVSDMEIELEKLKRGDIKVVRNIELLVVDKREGSKLVDVFKPSKPLEVIAKELGVDLERLRVSRGELVEVLDKEVWRAKVGDVVMAEDKDHIYIARVISEENTSQDKDIEEIKQEILLRKIEQRKQELIERLRKNSFVKVLQ
ncbi:MAG TPA: peptidylprolyl isomerase [Aquificaceae bacterium]|nr:peptidylprolyl isomerase [Aquificaceae bacterium]